MKTPTLWSNFVGAKTFFGGNLEGHLKKPLNLILQILPPDLGAKFTPIRVSNNCVTPGTSDHVILPLPQNFIFEY